MNNELITRNFTAEFRADEESVGKVIGRPIVYDKKTDLGWCEEIIERGALNGADLTDVLFFVNHDTSKIPLARSRRNNKNSTMYLTLDNEGMEVELTLDIENNSDARNLYSAITRKDITGMSFMFRIDSQQWDNVDSDKPLRRIKKISTVKEVSAVNFPAYNQTTITARDKGALDSARLALDNARKRSVDTDLELEKLKCKYLFGGKE